MQVFISWSGDRSKRLGAALRDWLPLVIQALEPWFSPEDTDKGAGWLSQLNTELRQRSVALICLTQENLDAPWLLFEAGALSKAIDSTCVSPLLLGVPPSTLQGPLAQFQATVAERSDVRRLLGTLNRRLDKPLEDRQLETAFNHLWPQLQQEIDTLLASAPTNHSPERTESSILDEVLAKVRTIERHIVESESPRKKSPLPPDSRRKRDRRNPTATLEARAERMKLSLIRAQAEIKAIDVALDALPATATDERIRLLDARERLETRIDYFESELAGDGNDPATS